jgi:hypothetical protein
MEITEKKSKKIKKKKKKIKNLAIKKRQFCGFSVKKTTSGVYFYIKISFGREN